MSSTRYKDAVSILPRREKRHRNKINYLMASLDMNKSDVYLRGVEDLYIKVKDLKLNEDDTS